ncbi:hypothetical protein K3152_05730 [Qipengyuania sp. 1NDH17]|uniref:TonB C-terminal domain-containing protein n=1 Tax=Qipengyuania polymorpha TaxID=2867234 RepID=A0ABS7IWM6_9SPHN|nr:hypothetical protein [Qipengyuania polymorpha]MBX7457738.1 hypothetical protein [Qipengyuania polymorpha]
MQPAKNAAGQDSFGKFVGHTKMVLPGSKMGDLASQYTTPPDMEISVAGLPAGYGEKHEIDVVVEVSETGVVTSCINPGSDDGPFGKAACDALSGSNVGEISDADGQARAYDRNMKVAFLVAD